MVMLECLVSCQIKANGLIILESYKDLFTNILNFISSNRGCMILGAMVFNYREATSRNYLYTEAQDLDHRSEIKVNADGNNNPKREDKLGNNAAYNLLYELNDIGEVSGDIDHNTKKVLNVD